MSQLSLLEKPTVFCAQHLLDVSRGLYKSERSLLEFIVNLPSGNVLVDRRLIHPDLRVLPLPSLGEDLMILPGMYISDEEQGSLKGAKDSGGGGDEHYIKRDDRDDDSLLTMKE